MDELIYLFNLGFSGSDAGRAILLGLAFSLLVSSRFKPWKAGIVAFLIDRTWPYADMYFQGYGFDAIVPAVLASVEAIPLDITFYLVRFSGILFLIYLGFNFRKFIHNGDSKEEKRQPGFNPY